MIGHYYFMKFFQNRKKKEAQLIVCVGGLLVLLAAFSAYMQLYPPARPVGVANSLVNTSDLSTPLPEGAIPAVYNPKFVSASGVTYPEDNGLVIGINYNGVTKAYPVKMMNWHEVVNDEFSGKPVAVTYCALCRTAIAFDSRVLGKKLTFGVTGLLYNSNTIMVDNETRSYWIQMTGQSFMGGMIGKTLEKIPADVTTWFLWKAKYPDTLVMSSNTGFDRDYGYDPYGGYEESSLIWYPVKNKDNRSFAKDIVYGVSFGGDAKAYPKSNVTSAVVINDEVGTKKLLVLYDKELDSVKVFDRTLRGNELNFELDGNRILDKATKSVWNADGVAVSGPLFSEKLRRVDATYGFWFVWAAFYPNTELFAVQTVS